MSTYGQKKKRQAIRQLQQSSKRAAHANPFCSGIKSPPAAGIATESSENQFVYKRQPEPGIDTELYSKKAASDKVSTLFGDDATSSNPFLKASSEPNPFLATLAKPTNSNVFLAKPLEPSPFLPKPLEPAPFLAKPPDLHSFVAKPSDPRLESRPSSSRDSVHSRIGTSSSTTSQPISERRLSIGKRNLKVKDANQREAAALVISSTAEVVSHANARKIGTCPYMCSVSEFNERTSQGIYSQFETINEEFVHELAVKEYKRASADQDESKVDDLRPPNVLLKTVKYLCQDLVDSYADDFDELYCYIWNRTRAIRKDITQQRLSDTCTVSVLETICRFHIFSGYSLSGSSNFEPKINNENLEKSLTSLRHLYTDLSNANQICVNEAEFRSYYALLNLNSGHIMYEMSHTPPRILNSEMIQFAISCCKAYSTNNFIRFFRLFRSGSFLCSSILYRYLNQVRQKAFVAIINSHTTTSTAEVEYPISKLARLLDFADVKEAEEFVTGMSVPIDGGVAILKKRDYEVNNNIVTGRIAFLDAKMTCTVGNVIFTVSSMPTDSLPSLPSAPTKLLITSGIQPLLTGPVTRTNINADVLTSPFLSESCERIVESLVAQVTLEEVSNIVSEVDDLTNNSNKCVVPMVIGLIEEVCEGFVREEVLRIKADVKQKVNLHSVEMFKEEYPDMLQVEIDGIVKEFVIEESESNFINFIQEDITHNVIKSELNKILSEEIQLFSDRNTMLADICREVYDDLFAELAEKELSSYSREVHQVLVADKKACLKEKLDTQIIQKRFYFKLWSKKYSSSYAKRHTLDKVPVRLYPSSSREVLTSLLGQKNVGKDNMSSFSISDIAHIDLSSPTKTQERKVSLHKKLKLRMDLLEDADTNLIGISLKCLASATKKTKITIVLQDVTTQLSNFILDCFSVPRSSDARSNKLESQIFWLSNCNVQVVNLAICSIRDLKQRSLGSSVIVINSSQLSKEHLEDVFTDVIVISPYQKIFTDCTLHVKEPLNSRNIDYCNFYKALDQQVHSALTSSSSLPQPDIKAVNVKDFIQATISSKHTDLLLAHQILIESERHLNIEPQPLIQAYNCLIDTLGDVLTTPDLVCVNWPSIFDERHRVDLSWNARDRLDQLFKDVSSLKLPQFSGDCYSTKDCLNYCETLHVFSLPFLMSKVNTMMNYRGLQWPIILNLCIHHIIENTPLTSSSSVLLSEHVSEVEAINLQSYFKDAIIRDEIESELLDYDEESVHVDEEDMLEMWNTISQYETELNMRKSDPRNYSRDSHVDTTIQEVETFEQDFDSFRSSMASTEQRLQDILNEGALPSYLMQTSLVGEALRNYKDL